MTEDRLTVAMLVLEGKLSEDQITLEEAYELQDLVMDVIIERLARTNPLVFYGVDNNTIN